jgi:hypothetical protein
VRRCSGVRGGIGVCAVALLGAWGAAAHGQAEAAAKVFDRTLVCVTGDGGPLISGAPTVSGKPNPGYLLLEQRFTGGTAEIFWADSKWGVHIDGKQCTRSTNKVPLTRKGLPGPPLRIGAAECPFGRVLLRIRYTYVPGPHPTNTEIGGRFISAEMAVRSYRTLKPLAYGTLTKNGRTMLLYSSPSCTYP